MEDWVPHLWQFHLTAGAVALVVALASVWAERRRLRRTNLDAVGFMPWTTVYFLALFIGCLMLGLAAHEWLAG